jgi:hypothetical protein
MTGRTPVHVTAEPVPQPGDEVIHLAPPLHDHGGAEACVACAAIGDVRVALYELLESRRLTGRPMPDRIVVDISAVPADAGLTRDRISGKAPAGALRDHVVARNFILADG